MSVNPLIRSVTAEYCMDPDASIISDEESLQTAIDMYNDRVVSEKHMVGRELSNQYHQRRLFLTIFNICRFTENRVISFRDVLKSFTPFGEKAIECFKRDNHREFVCLEIVSAYYQSCIWKKKLNSNLKLSSNSNPRLQNLSR